MPFGQRFDGREAFCRRTRPLEIENRSDPEEDRRDIESAAPGSRLGSPPLLQMDHRRTQAYDFHLAFH